MVSPSPSLKSPMPQEQTVETLAPTCDNDDFLSRLLFVSTLSCLSVAGIVFFVSDILELIQVLVADAGARYI